MSTTPRPLHPLAAMMLAAWGVLLVGSLTSMLFHPGALALRDMLVLPSPAPSASAFGLGDLPARNAPQDGILALAGQLIDASYLARVIILGSAIAGAWGSLWLIRSLHPDASSWAMGAGMTIGVYNPYVVERLLQGHWSLVCAAWLLPLIAAAGIRGRTWTQALATFACTLTPTGALAAGLTGVFTATTWARKLAQLLVAGAASVPWLIPSLTAAVPGTSLAQSATAFAPRAERFASTAGSLIGLGGIWNNQAVPTSRESGFALFGVILFCVLLLSWRRCPRSLLVLGGVGMGWAVFSWLLPEVTGLIVSTTPGGGLLRDAHKWLLLAVPAYVTLAGGLDRAWAALALGLAVAQIPDAPLALQALKPVHVQIDEELVHRAAGRDVYFPDQPTLTIRADGAVIVNPLSKALSTVESGALSVDRIRTDLPTERYLAVERAWKDGDLNRLERLGVGMVVAPDGTIVETAAPPAATAPGWFLTAWWLLLGVGLSAAAYRRRP